MTDTPAAPGQPVDPTKTPDLTGDNRRPDGTFGPGNNANPDGRPKGSVSLTTLIRQKLQEAPPGQLKALGELIAEKILHKAFVDGNDAMLKEVWHYIDGMPNQKVDFGVDKENVGELTAVLSALAKKPNVEPKPADNISGGDAGGEAK